MSGNPYSEDHRPPPKPVSARSSSPEMQRIRKMLAYCILHAEAAHEDRLEACRILADDPLIGISHPAMQRIVKPAKNGWSLNRNIVEEALGRRLSNSEGPEDALQALRLMMETGNF